MIHIALYYSLTMNSKIGFMMLIISFYLTPGLPFDLIGVRLRSILTFTNDLRWSGFLDVLKVLVMRLPLPGFDLLLSTRIIFLFFLSIDSWVLAHDFCLFQGLLVREVAGDVQLLCSGRGDGVLFGDDGGIKGGEAGDVVCFWLWDAGSYCCSNCHCGFVVVRLVEGNGLRRWWLQLIWVNVFLDGCVDVPISLIRNQICSLGHHFPCCRSRFLGRSGLAGFSLWRHDAFQVLQLLCQLIF